MKITARAKELYDDPIVRSTTKKLQDDVLKFLDDVVSKHVNQLQDHGLSEGEAASMMLGCMLAQTMQALHDLTPLYTRDKLMDIVGTSYDFIHMGVTDEEMLGGKKPS